LAAEKEVSKKTKRINEILDAALGLALARGLNSTTMEAIAKQANISKATLYAYFANKQQIFTAITARFFDTLKILVETGLNKDLPLSDRIALALSSKYKVAFRLFAGSAHKDEIYSQKSNFAGKEVEEFEIWLQQKISQTLLESGHKQPQKYAQIILACAKGISQSATSASQIGPAIRLVVKKLL